MPTLSVIVLTCSRPDRCVDSVSRNARELAGLDAEIILINNGGPAIRLPEIPESVPIRLVELPDNRGIAARNLGTALATSEHLLFLDDDAYITAPAVRAMLTVFREQPGIAATAFRIQNSTAEEACLLPTVFHGCACGFRRAALLEVGGYPEHFLYYGEEYDLAFRLYRAGHSIAILTGTEPVFHARDSAGRNVNRIIHRLVRNNTFLLVASLPWPHVPAALRDTLQRYRAVAVKESAMQGWRAGMAAAPAAIVRALLSRQRLSPETFATVSLQAPLASLAARLSSAGIHRVALCGVGKFPSLWQAELKRSGISVEAFLDFNPCWRGLRIHGTPVLHPVDEAPPPDLAARHWITGLASRTDNRRWHDLAQRHGRLAGVVAPQEKVAAGVAFEILDAPEHAFFAAAGRKTTAACALLSNQGAYQTWRTA